MLKPKGMFQVSCFKNEETEARKRRCLPAGGWRSCWPDSAQGSAEPHTAFEGWRPGPQMLSGLFVMGAQQRPAPGMTQSCVRVGGTGRLGRPHLCRSFPSFPLPPRSRSVRSLFVLDQDKGRAVHTGRLNEGPGDFYGCGAQTRERCQWKRAPLAGKRGSSPDLERLPPSSAAHRWLLLRALAE